MNTTESMISLEPNSAPAQSNLPAAPPPLRWKRVAFIAGILVLLGLCAGFLPRLHARRALVKETQALSIPTVEVVSPEPGKAPLSAPLPAEIQAFVEAPIYARANGYLKRWLVDIGEHVDEGQLLAEIDTPELDQQLAQARAELQQAEAAFQLAKTTAMRWTELLKSSSVSEQETAEKQADRELKSAVVEAARANVRRLEEVKGFTRVTAPFAGTITARQTDVGQLIVAGNGKELFRLAKTNPLRVFVRVPQTLSRAVQIGQTADIALDELPGRKFEAKVVRTADAIDPASRTLLTELELDNSHDEILAGSYAQARFADVAGDPLLTLPANTLLFRSEGMLVGVVGEDGHVDLRSIKLGRDFGQAVEVAAGVSSHDRVIVNPSDSLTDGATVRVADGSKSQGARSIAQR